MKLSKETLQILNNFGVIAPNFLFREGSKISTTKRTLIGEAVVSETFPCDFGIYNLPDFLRILNLVSDPEIEFCNGYMLIRSDKACIKYVATDASLLILPPAKGISFPGGDVEFTLAEDDIAKMKKSSAVLRVPDVCFIGDGSTLRVEIKDKQNPSGNSFSHEIGQCDIKFQANFLDDNLKFVEGSYDVSISSKKIARFSSTNGTLTYFVAAEADSRFE